MNDFWIGLYELLKQNVIIRGLIAFSLILTLCIMLVNGQKVPSELVNILLVVLGFYFGGLTQAKVEEIKKNG